MFNSCRFDSLRITPRSLDILARGSPVCGDLAVALSQAGPQFTQVRHGFHVMHWDVNNQSVCEPAWLSSTRLGLKFSLCAINKQVP